MLRPWELTLWKHLAESIDVLCKKKHQLDFGMGDKAAGSLTDRQGMRVFLMSHQNLFYGCTYNVAEAKQNFQRNFQNIFWWKKWRFSWRFSANSDIQLNMFWSQILCIFLWNIVEHDITFFRIIVQNENEIRIKVLDFWLAFGSAIFCWNERIKFCEGFKIFFLSLYCTLYCGLQKRQAFIKACVRYFLSNFYFSPNEKPSKSMKNVFYFV